MERYRRLSLMEREEFSRMLTTGTSLRATAQLMKRAPITQSREFTRHRTSSVTYRAVPAHQRGSAGPTSRESLSLHPLRGLIAKEEVVRYSTRHPQ